MTKADEKNSENIIEVKNLVKKFGNFTAVNNVSFNVKKGQMFAFLGPNGAGKSTTIKILTTILERTSGEIKIDSLDPEKEKDKARKSFGIVFQDPSLDDDLTAYENLEFHATFYGVPNKEIKPRIEKLMKFVELWERKGSLVKTFSGGMKRRLEIARGLIHHPKILFLDEPTLGLDPQTRDHLWGYIKKMNKEEGMTVFLTTHYMNEAEEVADTIAIIDHGKIIEKGSANDLKKKTKTKTLEEAFLNLTGHEIRDESASAADNFRNHAKAWGRRR